MTDSPPLLFQVTPLGLRPANDEATNACKSLKGQVKVEVKQARGNDRRLALYWTVAKTAAENFPMEDGTMTKEALHVLTKRKLGLSKLIGLTKGGAEIWDDGSISFAKMPENERAAYIDQAFEIWANALGVTKDELVEWKDAA